MMNTEKYNQYRQEVQSIIEKSLKQKSLSTLSRQRLAFLREKHKQERALLVLMGQFQGGKSTTFDALCDGREISPRGNMLKTSACRIAAHYLEAGADEYACVNFKSTSELKAYVFDIINHTFNEEDIHWLSKREEQGTDGFGYADVRLFASRKLSEAWACCSEEAEEERSHGSSSHYSLAEEVERLAIARNILKFYDEYTARYARQSKLVCSISEVARYVVFPSSFSGDMTEDGNGSLKLDDILFVFVKSVDVFIDSEWLRENNCSIVDVPGLGAGSYDKSIAYDVLNEADAVMYILNGQKASLFDTDAQSLLEMSAMGQMLGKPWFFVLNSFITGPLAHNLVETVRKPFLRQYLGLKAEVTVYHAQLFFLAKFAQRQLKGVSSSRDLESFLLLAERMYGDITGDWQHIWQTLVQRCFLSLGLLKAPFNPADDITSEMCEKCLVLSGYEKLLSNIHKELIAPKMETRLLTFGTRALMEVVNREKELAQQTIRSISASESELESAYLLSENLIDQYNKTLSQELNLLLYKKEAFFPMISECAERISSTSFLSLLSRDIAASICSNTTLIGNIWALLCGSVKVGSSAKEELRSKLIPYIKPCVEQRVGDLMATFFADYQNGQLQSTDNFYSLLMKIDGNMKKWYEKELQSENLLFVPSVLPELRTYVQELQAEFHIDSEMSQELGSGVTESTTQLTTQQVTTLISGAIGGIVVMKITLTILFLLTDFLATSGVGTAVMKVLSGGAFLALRILPKQCTPYIREWMQKQKEKKINELAQMILNGKNGQGGLRDMISFSRLTSCLDVENHLETTMMGYLYDAMKGSFTHSQSGIEIEFKKKFASSVHQSIQANKKLRELEKDSLSKVVQESESRLGFVKEVATQIQELEIKIKESLMA